MNSKNLHKHSMPIVLLAIAAVIAVCGATFSSDQVSVSALADSITSKTVSVQARSNGWAEISTNTGSNLLDTTPNPAAKVAFLVSLSAH